VINAILPFRLVMPDLLRSSQAPTWCDKEAATSFYPFPGGVPLQSPFTDPSPAFGYSRPGAAIGIP
jgi:hypothetical protein